MSEAPSRPAPPREAEPPGGDALRIERIETVALRVPLARIYRGSHYRMTHRSTLVTRVHCGDGLVGEAYAGDEDATLGEIERIVHEEIEPRLRGEDARGVERCWQLARPVTYDILRDRRLGLVASAGVDAALWDAVGKQLGAPLWRLWGGYTRRLPLLAIGGYYGADQPLEAEVEALLGLGLRGLKLKVGGLAPAEDAERVARVRRAAGPDFHLAVDANQAWGPREAIDFARRVGDLDVLWFEEPCRWHNDRRAMRDVRLSAGIPVCAGQSEHGAGGCRDLMVEGAIDVCNFDASWSGGPTEWRRVAGMALPFDVRMAHHEEPQLSAHLLASIPHGTFVECFHPDRDPIWWNLIANRPAIEEGTIALSERPGLGWELDRDYLERFRVR